MPEPTTIKIEMDEMKKNAEEVAELLRVMAHPERLMVLCQLTQSEMGVGQLQQGSTLSQSAFSQHLTVLRKHGIIQARKESQQGLYRLAASRITAWIQSLQNVFCR